MKYIIIVLSSLFSFLSFADQWDNLTYAEAEAIIAELKDNPYIFDYCDCCDSEGEYATTIQFLKVIDTEIETCSWDENFYSVKAHSIFLGHVFYSSNGADVSRLTPGESSDYSQLIFMNYTWTFHPEKKVARPFFDIIPYDYYGSDQKPCKDEFAYPTPAQLKKVSKDKGYKKWYKKVMKG